MGSVLMTDERHLVVDPLYMVENPYARLNNSSLQIMSLKTTGANINYGSKSQSSSMDTSPVDPELGEFR